MKKLTCAASYLVLAAGALSSVASAQDNPAASRSKLVQIVRNSTIQYQNSPTPPRPDMDLSSAASPVQTTEPWASTTSMALCSRDP